MQLPASAANAAFAISDTVEPPKGCSTLSGIATAALQDLMEPAGDASDSLGLILVTDPTAAANIECVLYVNLAWLV
jgi:hypothetical protein